MIVRNFFYPYTMTVCLFFQFPDFFHKFTKFFQMYQFLHLFPGFECRTSKIRLTALRRTGQSALPKQDGTFPYDQVAWNSNLPPKCNLVFYGYHPRYPYLRREQASLSHNGIMADLYVIVNFCALTNNRIRRNPFV